MNRLDDPRYDMIYLNPEDDMVSTNLHIGANYCIVPAQTMVVESKVEETDKASNSEQEFSQIQEIGVQSSDGGYYETSDKSPDTVEIDVGHSVFDNSDPPLEELVKKDDGFFYCRYCNNCRSTIRKEIVRHERIHSGPIYDCPFENCGKKFTRREHMKRHYVNHTGERPYQCEVCEKRFKRKDHCLKHVRGHRPKRLKCRYCIHTFLDNQSLATHEEIIHDNKHKVVKIEVEIKKETPNTNQFSEEILNVEIDSDRMDNLSENDKSYSCRYCNYSSFHRSHLESHERTHTAVELYVGDSCNDSFVKKESDNECYVTRIKYEELDAEEEKGGGEEEEEDVECHNVDEGRGGEGGGGEEDEEEDLTDQIEIDINKYLVFDKNPKNIPLNQPKDLYTCQYCNKEFNRKVSWLRHTRYVHVGKPSHECTVCDRKFVRRDHLKKHLMTHLRKVEKEKLSNGLVKNEEQLCETEEKVRNELDRIFKSRSVNPSRHIGELVKYNKSEALSGFSCDTKSELAAHEKTHEGTRPYQCSYCPSTFSRLHHLSRHTSTHTGEKPYSCDICDKLFYRKDHLAKHLLVHSGEKPYQCSFCPKAFRRPYLMRSHEKTHSIVLEKT